MGALIQQDHSLTIEKMLEGVTFEEGKNCVRVDEAQSPFQICMQHGQVTGVRIHAHGTREGYSLSNAEHLRRVDSQFQACVAAIKGVTVTKFCFCTNNKRIIIRAGDRRRHR